MKDFPCCVAVIVIQESRPWTYPLWLGLIHTSSPSS